MTKTNYSKLLLTIAKDGHPDQRFNNSLGRICNELGHTKINELIDFCTRTALLQKCYAQPGLPLVVAIFNEVIFLELHHYFDTDNRYGYESKVLRKQEQQTLERIGFTKKNVHKLVSTADWLSSQHIGTDEQEWFKSFTPSHLYELSRMSHEGFNFVNEHVLYPDFTFSVGQQDISVRQLEQIRRSYPKKERPFNEASFIPESVKANTRELPSIRTTQVIEVCGADITERRQLELAT